MARSCLICQNSGFKYIGPAGDGNPVAKHHAQTQNFRTVDWTSFAAAAPAGAAMPSLVLGAGFLEELDEEDQNKNKKMLMMTISMRKSWS